MSDFYGKCYIYKNKIIGVCNALTSRLYMIGYKTADGHKRMKRFPINPSKEGAQIDLDIFAGMRFLPEATPEETTNDEELKPSLFCDGNKDKIIDAAPELFDIVQALANCQPHNFSALKMRALEFIHKLQEE